MELQNSLLSQYLKLVSKLLLIVLVLTLGITAARAQWVGPSDPPPQTNTPTPINVGTDTQIISGDLGVQNIGALSAEVESYIKVGDITDITCDASTDGALGMRVYPVTACLMFCIDTGYSSYEWVSVSCLETA